MQAEKVTPLRPEVQSALETFAQSPAVLAEVARANAVNREDRASTLKALATHQAESMSAARRAASIEKEARDQVAAAMENLEAAQTRLRRVFAAEWTRSSAAERADLALQQELDRLGNGVIRRAIEIARSELSAANGVRDWRERRTRRAGVVVDEFTPKVILQHIARCERAIEDLTPLLADGSRSLSEIESLVKRISAEARLGDATVWSGVPRGELISR
jgi:hypothetical protein